MIMKKNKLITFAISALCCLMLAGAWGVSTLAASDAASVGKISVDGGKAFFCSEDITYLNGKLGSLQDEIDDSILDNASAYVTVFGSANRRRNRITSHGIISYDHGKVVANAADLVALADEIDTLADTYTTVVCRALNDIGTYFDRDGNVNHEAQVTEPITLDCERLVAGILQSQSVEHITQMPVSAGNITAGAAAWVNGKCIIGTGADNERAYQRGIEDGTAGTDTDVDIRSSFHAHRNGVGEEVTEETVYAASDPGGCFVGNGHKHDAVDACATESVRCTGRTGDIEHHPLCVDSGSGYGTDVGHVHCMAACQTCGYRMPAAYSPCNNVVTSYICGEPTNTWTVGCGLEKGQLESVTVVIQKNNVRRE